MMVAASEVVKASKMMSSSKVMAHSDMVSGPKVMSSPYMRAPSEMYSSSNASKVASSITMTTSSPKTSSSRHAGNKIKSTNAQIIDKDTLCSIKVKAGSIVIFLGFNIKKGKYFDLELNFREKHSHVSLSEANTKNNRRKLVNLVRLKVFYD